MRRSRREAEHPLLPSAAVTLPVNEVVQRLAARLPAQADRIDAILGGEDHRSLPPPATREASWIKRANICGINVRTIGSIWKVISYSLTLPASVDAVHLLPLWEPGVVSSLYGMASWDINDEFFDADLAREYPALHTVETQLGAVVSLLHLQERAVGIDVVPHTDRFSEIVLCNPSYFEWIKRDGTRIIDHSADLYQEVEQILSDYAGESAAGLFASSTTESARRSKLFGSQASKEERNRRREQIIDLLYESGLETAPATMGPPYRGLVVDPQKSTTDGKGRVWYDYGFEKPEPASRAFGPLARYSFFGRLNNNRNWEIDFSRPRVEVFDYLAGHITHMVRTFAFDFMRGDMSHVQMRPGGAPATPNEFYDPLGYVKRSVARVREGFAYFAESFLAPPGTMAYGDEVDHLELSDCEATLGDLQSVPVSDEAFLQRLRRYRDIAVTRRFTPCFTVMTGDKDDPRFDSFYLSGNELRAFCAYFLVDMPSYTALGFELRDPHPEPVANEFYTKLYVFRETKGKKATRGPYRFGGNTTLYANLSRIHSTAGALLPAYRTGEVRWLLPPDAKGKNRVLAWLISPAPDAPAASSSPILCLANTNTDHPVKQFLVPLPAELESAPGILFSTEPDTSHRCRSVALPGSGTVRLLIDHMQAGECRIYAWSNEHTT